MAERHPTLQKKKSGAQNSFTEQELNQRPLGFNPIVSPVYYNSDLLNMSPIQLIAHILNKKN